MKRLIVFVLILSLTLLTACGGAQTVSGTVFAMDTVVSYTLCGPGELPEQQTAEALARYEALFSVTAEGSDVWHINHAVGPTAVSDDVAAVLRTAGEVYRQSGGAFDISIWPVVQAWGFTTGENCVPSDEELAACLALVDGSRIRIDGGTVTLDAGMGIDLGGIAKGYIAQQIVAQWKQAGVTGGLLSVGGNIQLAGPKPDGSDWLLGVQDPFAADDPARFVGVLSLREGAVVTSGDYHRYFESGGVRYHHILDPRTGCPARSGLRSVTVLCQDGALADALSTALFVLGEQGAIAFCRQYGGFEMLLVTDDGRVLATPGADEHFTPDSAFAAQYTVLPAA